MAIGCSQCGQDIPNVFVGDQLYPPNGNNNILLPSFVDADSSTVLPVPLEFQTTALGDGSFRVEILNRTTGATILLGVA